MERFKKITNSSRLLNRSNIKKIHNRYKKNLPKKHENFDYQEVIKINQLILKEVSEALINNTSGVVLDGFGYFCIWRTPEKIKVRNLTKDSEGEFYFNPHSQGYFYLPTLFTDVLSNTILTGWSLDGSFNRRLKTQMSTKIKKGFKYRFLYSLVKSLKLRYRNQQNRKLIKGKKW